MRDDDRFMDQALQLARVPPFTSPNPRVGAVVVRDGEVIGRGYHAGPGSPHAEIVALNEADPSSATLYVTLEPCAHHAGTPPCAPAVVQAGLERVVFAMEDPDERVRGRGRAVLVDGGLDVTSGVREEEARALNAPYVHHRTTGRPWLTLKLALSLDGRLAASDGSSTWITSDTTRRWVHARRLEADAVLLGSGSVLADDPLLTVRAVAADRQPARVLADSRGRIPPEARVFGQGAEVIVATTHRSPHEVHTAWKQAGAEVLVFPARDERVDLAELLSSLGSRGFVEVYCEGGAELATELIATDLVNRLEVHFGPLLLGRGGPEIGDIGVHAMGDATRWRTVDVRRSDDDVLVTLERRRS